MIKWAIIFAIIGVIAGVLGFGLGLLGRDFLQTTGPAPSLWRRRASSVAAA
jgi:hypothetical protein